MPTAAASIACAAPRVTLRSTKRRAAIAKPPASRRSTRSCARGRAAELCPRVRLARVCVCVRNRCVSSPAFAALVGVACAEPAARVVARAVRDQPGRQAARRVPGVLPAARDAAPSRQGAQHNAGLPTPTVLTLAHAAGPAQLRSHAGPRDPTARGGAGAHHANEATELRHSLKALVPDASSAFPRRWRSASARSWGSFSSSSTVRVASRGQAALLSRTCSHLPRTSQA